VSLPSEGTEPTVGRQPAHGATASAEELARRRAGIAARRAALPAAQRARLAAILERGGGAGVATRVVPRRPDGEPAPLSFAQQRLWFLHRLDPESVAYNLPLALRLRGPLDAGALRTALGDTVRRHEVLRTTFRESGGEPLQVVAPPAPVRLETLDLERAGGERGADWRAVVRRQARRPFDLARGPLMRAHLLRLVAEDHVLLVVFHHVVADGWSLQVFVRDLGTFYAAAAEGRAAQLDELPIQYADFAAWQRHGLGGEALELDLAYWRRQLAGAPSLLRLPLDRPRPPAARRQGRILTGSVGGELTAALRGLARARGVTLFVPLLAALQLVLARYAGETDVVVGTPVSGRRWVETEELVGFFVNTLALRTRLAGAADLDAVLDRVAEVVLDAQSHQDLPFERLVEELGVERSLSYTPLFQVMLALQNVPPAAAAAAAVSVEEVPLDPGAEKFDLTLSVAEEESRLALALGYDTALFDAATAEALLGHWQRVLEALAGDRSRSPWAVDLLDPAERRQLVATCRPAAAFPVRHRGLAERFEASAAAHADEIAAVCEASRVTYAELDRRANRLARHLRSLGVGPEALVGVLMHRGLDLVTAILGILKAGGAYLPLDPGHPPERRSWVLADAGATVVLGEPELTAELPPGLHVVEVGGGDAAFAGESGEPLARRTAPEHAAYVIYTSGSTGRPKGVVVTHGNVLRLFAASEAHFAFGAADVWTLFHSPAFDFSVWELWGALLYGGRLVVVPHWVGRSPDELLDLLAEQSVTVLNQTPSAFVQLVEAERRRPQPASLPALRLVIFGGEALDAAALAPWFERHPETPALVNMYGITETTVHVTHQPVGAAAARAGQRAQGSLVGRPLPDLAVQVLDRRGRLAPDGVAGELCVGGAGLARGYKDRPALTAERFVPDPHAERPGARLYRSGDLARRRRDGGLEYLGRIDQQVKVRGHRIELGEIEAALRQIPEVADAAVVDREDERLGRHLAAYYVAAPGAEPAVDTLRASLRRTLPEYMVPAAWTALPALPLTANGKVDRRALPEPAAAAGGGARGTKRRGEIEGVLAAVWASVLGVEAVRPEDNFFDLGGHSLLATQVVARLAEHLGATLPVRSLFETSSLAELAAVAEAELRERQGLALPPLGRRPDGERLPMSSAQQRLWFLAQLDPASSAYNLPASAELVLDLDHATLRRSLEEIVRRHETLRTRFVNVKGQPRPVVDAPAPLPLPVADLTGLAAGPRQARAAALAEAEALAPFDLAAGPLVRFTLLRLAPDRHRLLVTLHHIVSDGWSMGVLMRELDALYQAFAAGRPSPLPELEVQYSDYAHWQRQWLKEEALTTRLGYWRERLDGAPEVLELATDRPRPRRLRQRGASIPVGLSPRLTAALHRLARELAATPFMVLMAAFEAFLGRHTGQDDLLVGTPTAGRGHVALEGLVGFFVNMVVIRARMADLPSFRELLRRVREEALGAYTHGDLPFDNVVEILQPARSLGRNPLFQVILSYQEEVPEEIEMAGVTVLSGSPGSADTKFDLEAYFHEGAERITGSLVYSPELFDRTTVTRMARHLERMIEAAVAAPDLPLPEHVLLAPGELHQALVEWNDTRAPYPEAGIHDIFAQRAAERPDAVALEASGREVTYRELDERSARLAARLRALGVAPGTFVGVLLERSVEAIVALLGTARAGGVYVPLNLEDPARRTRFILADAGVSILLSTREIAGDLPEHGMRVLCLDAEGEEEAAEADAGGPPAVAAAWRPAGADDLLYRMYTSGSTGTPKGVGITHRNVLRLVCGASYADFGPRHVFLQFAPLSFDASTFEIWGCLLHGGRLVLHVGPAPTLAELRQRIETGGVTTLWLTAGLFHQLAAGKLGGLEKVEQLLAGGEALSRPHAEQLFAKLPSCRLINGYGPTETTTFACCHPVERGRPGEAIPIGRPIANTRVVVVNEALRPVAVGERGELLIGGDGLGRGYLDRPALTAERFVPDPFAQRPGERLYRTGDVVRRRRGGEIEFLGRRDDQVKLRGFRIELGEIETALAGHPEVREAVVVVREDVPGDKRLIAYVGAAAEPLPASEALRAYLEERLPDYMVPGMWVILDALPLTPHGKVDRRALPAPDRTLVTAGRELVPPRDELQRQLVEIWEKVLGINPIGVTDDFFELGGHSLLMVQLIARIEEKLGKRVPMTELLSGATIDHLSGILRQEREPTSFSVLVPMQPAGSAPPLFCVHPAGGNLFCYTDLVRHLGEEQPFYGIQADGSQPAFGTSVEVESVAADYLRAVRAFQPEGPYRLGGWSMGGVIAFEMARQLEAAGQTPELLAIMDAEAPSGREAVYTWVVLLGSFALDLGLPMERLYESWDEIDALPPMGQLKRVAEEAKRAGLVPQDMNLAQFRKLFDSFKTNAQMMRRYVGGSYGGRIDLFRADEHLAYIGREMPTASLFDLEHDPEQEGVDPRDPAKGWGQWAAGGLAIHSIPGNHYTMVREPNVELLAEQLLARIATASKEG
jgi:amino acid adenylation domain-containing protein